MMRSTAAMAAAQPFVLPLTGTLHELYEVALTPVLLLNTPAFMYRLASRASAAPCVMRPYPEAPHVVGSNGRESFSSFSTNAKTSLRVALGYCLSSVLVTIGT